MLVRDGFKGTIYSTHATRSLCAIMLLDSAYIQEKDADYYNKKLDKQESNKPRRVPLYTTKDVEPAMNLFVTTSYNRWHKISDDIMIRFSDAGHILGSAGVTIKILDKGSEVQFGFTGDIGRPNRPILRDPQALPEVDFLICESTYGDKEHESNPEQTDRLASIIKRTIDKNGKVIIPAFSVGRTQEIVYIMDKMINAGQLPKIKVYVDSPLAVNATEVFGSHPECFDDELNQYLLVDDNPFGFKGLIYVRDVNQSKALNTTNEPCVIISSSGMANAGRVKHHIANNVEDSRNTILIVGYCSPETPGGLLKSGVETIKLFGEWKQVRAKIEVLDSFSAHGDRKEMYHHIKNQKNKLQKLFLVHGEEDTMNQWSDYLRDAGFKNIYIPNEGESVALNFK
jgi:metallo-beta-lactamase family protein